MQWCLCSNITNTINANVDRIKWPIQGFKETYQSNFAHMWHIFKYLRVLYKCQMIGYCQLGMLIIRSWIFNHNMTIDIEHYAWKWDHIVVTINLSRWELDIQFSSMRWCATWDFIRIFKWPRIKTRWELDIRFSSMRWCVTWDFI